MAAPNPVFYASDDVTIIGSTISSTVNAGSTLAAVVYHLFNDHGGSLGSSAITNGRLVAEAYDGSNWLRSGLPCLDEGWLQVQLTGQDTTGDASMEAQTSGLVSLGTNRFLLLKNISSNCARYISAQIVVPAGAANATNDMRLTLVYNETTIPLAYKVGLLAGGPGGVLPQRLDLTVRRLSIGRSLTAAGTAVVTVGNGGWSYDGSQVFRIAETLTLDQNAADGALGVGQSYIATISQPSNSAPVATKSNKGASPTAPGVPAGNILLGKVTVVYQAGGTSIINTGNLDMTGVVYGDYYVRAAAGLNVSIGSGQAITSTDAFPFTTGVTTLAMPPSSTNHVWLLPDGTFVARSSGASPFSPADGAIALAQVVTDGSSVTVVVDVRTYTGPALNRYTMTLKYMGPTAVAANVDWDVLPMNAILESWRLSAGTYPTGATPANDVVVDVNYAGAGEILNSRTTIFTSEGTEDHRPRLLGGSVSSVGFVGAQHEVTGGFSAGTEFGFDIDVVGANVANDLVLQLYFRPI